MVQSFTSAEKSTRVPAAHCTKPNLPWRIQHFVLHLEVRRGQPDMLAQSCWWIPQACRWSARGRRDLVENPRTWSAPHHWVHQTRLDLTTVTQQNWLETRIFTAMITNWSVYGNTWIITVNWFVPKKGKEECLYNALYILCIAQSAQAWITQFYLQIHHACISLKLTRSGLAVACLTAVWEDPGSNLTAGGCVYHDSHCDIQPWARAAHPYCSA